MRLQAKSGMQLVACLTTCLLSQGDVVWRTRLLACYLAAICHDYEHRCVFGSHTMLNAGALCVTSCWLAWLQPKRIS